jgi:hypothetical protein
MAVVKLDEERRRDGIDLDRVIVDPDYRRRVMERLRGEAVTHPAAPETRPSPGDDD